MIRTQISAPCLYLLLITSCALAADRYYVGPTNGLWSDPNNWSASPNGPGGAGVPASFDNATVSSSLSTTITFDGQYTANVPLFSLRLSGSTHP